MAEAECSQQLVEYRLQLLEKAAVEISCALVGIKDSLATLATLQAHHAETRDALARAFRAIADLDTRVDIVEKALPILNLTSGWVRTGVVCLAGLVLMAIVKMVIL